MAKRGTLDHPKTLHLANLLKLQPWMALGLLEALWHWVGKYAPTGDISNFDFRLIADGMRYKGDCSKMREALVESKWLDAFDGHLLIHNWPDHADNTTKKNLKYRKGDFSPLYREMSRLTVEKISLLGRDFSGGIPPLPNQSQSLNQNHTQNQGSGAVDGVKSRYDDLLEVWPQDDRREVDLGCQVWLSLVDAGEVNDFVEVEEGLERWKGSEQWQKDGGKYRPSIAKWLQKRAWKDYPRQADGW